jgi:hypothetical protein
MVAVTDPIDEVVIDAKIELTICLSEFIKSIKDGFVHTILPVWGSIWPWQFRVRRC